MSPIKQYCSLTSCILKTLPKSLHVCDYQLPTGQHLQYLPHTNDRFTLIDIFYILLVLIFSFYFFTLSLLLFLFLIFYICLLSFLVPWLNLFASWILLRLSFFLSFFQHFYFFLFLICSFPVLIHSLSFFLCKYISPVCFLFLSFFLSFFLHFSLFPCVHFGYFYFLSFYSFKDNSLFLSFFFFIS